jgi:tRNA threonylcarbamoyladenosine biosynthesis protein TsaB
MIEKPILAIETSDELCGVSVFFNQDKHIDKTSIGKYNHSKNLLTLIDSAIQESNTRLPDLKWIAVSAGPGSFTGLRIGLSAAKGIALGADIPVVLVPTFEAAALQLLNCSEINEQFVFATIVNSEEIFFSSFINKGNIFNFVEELQLIKKEDLNERANGRKIFSNCKEFSNVENNNLSLPEPYFVAKWSMLFGEKLASRNFDYFEPNYFKQFTVVRR